MDIMLDLETMGSSSKAAVASIGAVAFDPKGNDTVTSITKDRQFYAVLNMRDQVKLGRQFDPDTIYWWMSDKVSPAARETICGVQEPSAAAIQRFADWIYMHRGTDGKSQRAWCLGATFDHVIIQSLFNDLGRRNPISYPNQLCFRTLKEFAEVGRPEVPELVGHNALDDAILQVLWMQETVRKIRGPKVNLVVDTEKIKSHIDEHVKRLEKRTNEQDPPPVGF